MITDEQILIRKSGIGGSDAAAICGVSRWKTPMDVFMDKKSELVENIQSPEMERGNILEPFIFYLLQKKYGINAKEYTKTARHKDYPFLLAHVDGLLDEGKKILEIKTTASREGWGESYTDEIPNEYLCQAHHYMNVMNADETLVAVLFGAPGFLSVLSAFVEEMGEIDAVNLINEKNIDLDIRFYTVKKNKALANVILKKEIEFWENNVLKNVAPDPSTINDVKKLFPEPKNSSLTANEEIEILVQKIRTIESEIKSMEIESEKAKKNLMEKIGEFEAVLSAEGQMIASWKSHIRKTLDTKSIAQSMPDIYEKFLLPKQIRVLKVY